MWAQGLVGSAELQLRNVHIPQIFFCFFAGSGAGAPRSQYLSCALLIITAIFPFITILPSAYSEEPKTLKLGGIFDLSSGAGAAWGIAERDSFLLAIEDFERIHPETKISFKIEDSAYSSSKSVTAVQKIASLDRIKYIIGPTWEVFNSVIPVCEARKIVCIAPSYNNESFEDPKHRYSFTAWFDDRDYARVHAPYINSHGYKRIALFASISPYYDSMVDSLLPLLKVKPLVVEHLAPEARDFKTLITKTPETIDALIVFILGDGGAQTFFRQWRELRKERPDVFTDDVPLFFNPPMDLSFLGSRIFYSTTDIHSGLLEGFNLRYKKKFGGEPGSSSGGVTYDSTMILLACMKKYDTDSEKVRDCVAETTNYSGVTGALSFNGGQSIKERKMIAKELR